MERRGTAPRSRMPLRLQNYVRLVVQAPPEDHCGKSLSPSALRRRFSGHAPFYSNGLAVRLNLLCSRQPIRLTLSFSALGAKSRCTSARQGFRLCLPYPARVSLLPSEWLSCATGTLLLRGPWVVLYPVFPTHPSRAYHWHRAALASLTKLIFQSLQRGTGSDTRFRHAFFAAEIDRVFTAPDPALEGLP